MKRIFALVMIFTLLLTFAGCSIFNREKEVEVVVYISDELSHAEARSVGTKLQQLPEVKQCTFISAEQALEDFIQRHEDSEAFAGIEEDILQHRFQITAKTADLDALCEKIMQIEGVDNVKYFEFVTF